ncbi:MAG: HAMP domain-containing sensor histidine kinase [Nitrospirales bacterium]
MDSWKFPPRRSMFYKLFVVFLVTALLLFVVIRGFFFLAIDRNHSFKADLFVNLAKYSTQLVAEMGIPPDQNRAIQLANELGVHFLVNTSTGTWSTDATLPKFSLLEIDPSHSQPGLQVGRYHRHPFVLVDRGDWQVVVFYLHRPFGELPAWSFALLVGVVGAIITGSFMVVRRLFRPVKWLAEGVNEMSQGHLDHQVPVHSTDELGELSKSFNAMAQRVRDMVQARDRLLVDVSHELRSPLTRMKLAVEFVQEKATKEKLQEEIRELEAMVTELLEADRLDSHHGGLVLIQTDIVSLVQEIIEMDHAQEPIIQLLASPSTVVLPIDQARVRLVLRNIFENAKKFSNPQSHPIDVRINQHSSSVLVSIQDYGRGIPPEEQALIFEPFYRVDTSRTRKTGGYGLGLSLAKKFMISHGGALLLQSELGRGSTFTLQFPVRTIE